MMAASTPRRAAGGHFIKGTIRSPSLPGRVLTPRRVALLPRFLGIKPLVLTSETLLSSIHGTTRSRSLWPIPLKSSLTLKIQSEVAAFAGRESTWGQPPCQGPRRASSECCRLRYLKKVISSGRRGPAGVSLGISVILLGNFTESGGRVICYTRPRS